MKLQGVTVIFSLIVIPIILVLSYFIQIQVDTIALQTSYDTKLIDATHGAMSAFEINTANESLSSVADSLRTIISASNNIFINTLATNLGMSNASKSLLEPYIPAVLYTLYEGYYIYAPTKTPVVLTNSKGNAVTVGAIGTSVGVERNGYTVYGYDKTVELDVDEWGNPKADLPNLTLTHNEDYGQVLYKLAGTENEYTTVVKEGITEYKLDFVLKSFMPYSARYIGTSNGKNVDIVINYTLDNYIIINGMVGNVYYSKSGYLIQDGLIDENGITVGGNADEGKNLLTYNEEKIAEVVDNIGGEIILPINLKDKDGNFITEKVTLSSNNPKEKEAIKYYLKSQIFSEWVYENLADIEEKDISRNAIENQDELYRNMQLYDLTKDNNGENGLNNLIYNFENSNLKIFNPNEDPEKVDSRINVHKTAIIRNSIQYNLNIAMSSYNEMSSNAFSFNMPVISDAEWKKITSNISIVSFMQGFRCGMKTYNNYAIVSSTNNELTVIPSEIYYISNSDGSNADVFNDENSTYHRIDCAEFNYPSGDPSITGNPTQPYNFFRSKEVKYDKIYNKTESTYEYDHKNMACYKCIVNGNYKKPYINDAGVKVGANPGEEGRYYNELDIPALSQQKQRLYYIALGYERNNIYKSREIKESQGLEVKDCENVGTNRVDVTVSSERPIKEMKQIKIIVSDIRSANNSTPVARFSVSINGHQVSGGNDVGLNVQEREQTIILDIDMKDDSVMNNFSVVKVFPPDEDILFTIKEIEIIYK
ncbi:MAG: hypothetical protein HFJ46_07470 [Clostridia bacterium]|nr:hypothetical protein [Clostridia bacterium]